MPESVEKSLLLITRTIDREVAKLRLAQYDILMEGLRDRLVARYFL